jgi:predicted DNA-binding transcriptional regulator AlpA
MSLEHSHAKITKRSFTIIEWCAMRGYSRPFFYTLLKRGDAPDTIGEGKAQRITDAADARWQKRQEQKAKRRKAAA